MADSDNAQRVRPPAGPDPDDPNYYELLGVPFTATTDAIQHAYRSAMKRTHPDRQPDATRRARAEEDARLLNRAYATLSKPDARRQYDLTIRTQEVQDQIMRRYVAGSMPAPGRQDTSHLNRPPSAAERQELIRANRSALLSLLSAFAVLVGVVLLLVLLYALVESVIGAVM